MGRLAVGCTRPARPSPRPPRPLLRPDAASAAPFLLRRRLRQSADRIRNRFLQAWFAALPTLSPPGVRWSWCRGSL